MRRILVTGAATLTGGRLIQALEQTPDTEVFAVDDLNPVERFTSRFERLDIDHLSFARYLLDVEPHTVVHLQTVDRSAIHGATRAHEETTVGAQALFGAIGRCETVRHVVVRSDGAVYGAGPRSPSVVTVNSNVERSGGRYQRDLEQMEERRLGFGVESLLQEVFDLGFNSFDRLGGAPCLDKRIGYCVPNLNGIGC